MAAHSTLTRRADYRPSLHVRELWGNLAYCKRFACPKMTDCVPSMNVRLKKLLVRFRSFHHYGTKAGNRQTASLGLENVWIGVKLAKRRLFCLQKMLQSNPSRFKLVKSYDTACPATPICLIVARRNITCPIDTSTCRNLLIISSGLGRLLAILDPPFHKHSGGPVKMRSSSMQ